MKKAILALALVVGLAAVSVLGHFDAHKQADGTVTTMTTTSTDPGDGSRP